MIRGHDTSKQVSDAGQQHVQHQRNHRDDHTHCDPPALPHPGNASGPPRRPVPTDTNPSQQSTITHVNASFAPIGSYTSADQGFAHARHPAVRL